MGLVLEPRARGPAAHRRAETGSATGAGNLLAVRILHVSTGRTWRGGERQNLLLMEGLRARGEEQALVAPRGSPLARAGRGRGLSRPRADDRGTRATWRRSRASPRSYGAISRTCCISTPRRRTASARPPSGSRAAAARPSIVTRRVEHSIYRHSFLRLDRLKYAPGADRVLCVSERVREVLRADGLPERPAGRRPRRRRRRRAPGAARRSRRPARVAGDPGRRLADRRRRPPRPLQGPPPPRRRPPGPGHRASGRAPAARRRGSGTRRPGPPRERAGPRPPRDLRRLPRRRARPAPRAGRLRVPEHQRGPGLERPRGHGRRRAGRRDHRGRDPGGRPGRHRRPARGARRRVAARPRDPAGAGRARGGQAPGRVGAQQRVASRYGVERMVAGTWAAYAAAVTRRAPPAPRPGDRRGGTASSGSS